MNNYIPFELITTIKLILLMKGSTFYLLLAVMGLVLGQNATYNTSTPTTSLFSFSNSPKDSRIIMPEQNLEYLESEDTTINGSAYTQMKIHKYNRSAAGNMTEHTLDVEGSWTNLQQSDKNLGCNVIYDSVNEKIGLVRFDETTQEFSVLGQMPLSDFTSSRNQSELRSAISISEDCMVLKYYDMNGTKIYHTNGNFSGLNEISMPNNWILQANSQDLEFQVANNKLYQFNHQTHQYDEKYTLPSFEEVQVKTYLDRVVVSGSNSIVVDPLASPPIREVSYDICVFHIGVGVVHMVHNFQITGVRQASLRREFGRYSPELTKLFFFYEKTNGDRGIIAKHVDYNRLEASDLQLGSTGIFDTIYGIDLDKEFSVHDFFLVVRNSSRFDCDHPCSVAVEEAYQFVGSQIIFVRRRILSYNYPCMDMGMGNMTGNMSMGNMSGNYSWGNMTGIMSGNYSWGNMSNSTNGSRLLQTNGTMNGSNMSMNGSWGNTSMNGSWSNTTMNNSNYNMTMNNSNYNMSMNGSWGNMSMNGSNMSMNGSWNNMSMNYSNSNMSMNGSWSNMSMNGSMGNMSMNGSWGNGSMNYSNMSMNGSWGNSSMNYSNSNMSINGSMGNMSTNGSWGNMSMNGSMGNMSMNYSNSNMSMNGSWNNMSMNGSWGNMSMNGSWGNMSLNGSWGNNSMNYSNYNMSMNGSWGNMSMNYSNSNMSMNGSWNNVSMNGSMGNMSMNGSMGNMSMNGSWSNMTMNNSMMPTLPCYNGDHQMSGFVRMWVDNSLADRLVWFGLYEEYDNMGNPIYYIQSFDYASLSSVNVIPKQTFSTAFINFTEPDHDYVDALASDFQWVYTELVNGSTTDVRVVTLDYTNPPSHVRWVMTSIPGRWKLLHQTLNCLLFEEQTAPYGQKLMKYNSINQTFMVDSGFNLNILLGNHSINTSQRSAWQVSRSCSKISLMDHQFLKDANGSWSKINNPNPNNTFNHYDQTLEYALGADDSIYKFNANSGQYDLFHNFTQGLPSGLDINVNQNIILLNGTDSTSAWVQAYSVDVNGGLTQIFNYAYTNFTQTPQIDISPNLNRVTVSGMANWGDGLRPHTQTFFVDYAAASFDNITFPVNNLDANVNNFFSFDDNFFYWREFSLNNQTLLQEYVYYFDLNIVPVEVFRRNITALDNANWQYSTIVQNGTRVFIFTQTLETINGVNYRIVNVTEINRYQALINEQHNDIYAVQVIDGQVFMCPPGCDDCQCTACLPGFVFDAATQICQPCAPGCSSCDSNDISLCTQCLPGTFLNISTSSCDRCDASCLSCSVSSMNCTECQSGQFFDGSLCNICPFNCERCYNGTTCRKCRKGFTLTSLGDCRGCSYSCSQCNPSNITECTACANGLQLKNGVCQPCPSNCLQCNGNQCGKCIKGYTVNSINVCVLKCQLPCVTCMDNQPSICLTCQRGSTLSNGQCVLNTTCNADNSCTNCGQGFKFFLVPTTAGAGFCSTCPTINNCVQCNEKNSYSCAVCDNGFYVKADGQCASCNSNCTDCKSSDICSGCKPGWTILEDYTEGMCVACQRPCLTCEGSPKYCTSCVGGATRQRWKCRNNSYVQFSFTITSHTPTEVLAGIDEVELGILIWLNQTDNDTSVVTFESVINGSTIISGTAEPTTTTATVGSSNMQSGLSSSPTIPGTTFVVTGSSVTAFGQTTTETSQSSNVGLIVGVVVGVVVLTVIIVILIVLYRKKKDTQPEPVGPLNTTEENMAVNVSNNTNADMGIAEKEKQNEMMMMDPMQFEDV